MGERGALKGGCNLTALGIRVGKLDRRGFVRGGRQTDRQTAGGRAEGTVPSRARDTGRRALETRHWAVCPGGQGARRQCLGAAGLCRSRPEWLIMSVSHPSTAAQARGERERGKSPKADEPASRGMFVSVRWPSGGGEGGKDGVKSQAKATNQRQGVAALETGV